MANKERTHVHAGHGELLVHASLPCNTTLFLTKKLLLFNSTAPTASFHYLHKETQKGHR
jgi:hypothetical protein